MEELITKEFLNEKIEKLERHAYSPEQNKLHFKGVRNFTVSTRGALTIEEAIDIVLKSKPLQMKIYQEFFS